MTDIITNYQDGVGHSKITGEILAISPDHHYLTFSPRFLMDMKTGEVIELPDLGLSRNRPSYFTYAHAFSPDGLKLAYTIDADVLILADLNAKTVIGLKQGNCGEYTALGKRCETIRAPHWIDNDTLLFAHREGLPSSFEAGSDDDPITPNHVTVMNIHGKTILSQEEEFGTDVGILGEMVFRYNPRSLGWMEKKALQI